MYYIINRGINDDSVYSCTYNTHRVTNNDMIGCIRFDTHAQRKTVLHLSNGYLPKLSWVHFSPLNLVESTRLDKNVSDFGATFGLPRVNTQKSIHPSVYYFIYNFFFFFRVCVCVCLHSSIIHIATTYVICIGKCVSKCVYKYALYSILRV